MKDFNYVCGTPYLDFTTTVSVRLASTTVYCMAPGVLYVENAKLRSSWFRDLTAHTSLQRSSLVLFLQPQAAPSTARLDNSLPVAEEECIGGGMSCTIYNLNNCTNPLQVEVKLLSGSQLLVVEDLKQRRRAVNITFRTVAIWGLVACKITFRKKFKLMHSNNQSPIMILLYY